MIYVFKHIILNHGFFFMGDPSNQYLHRFPEPVWSIRFISGYNNYVMNIILFWRKMLLKGSLRGSKQETRFEHVESSFRFYFTLYFLYHFSLSIHSHWRMHPIVKFCYIGYISKNSFPVRAQTIINFVFLPSFFSHSVWKVMFCFSTLLSLDKNIEPT